MMTDEVSVITTVYNGQEYFERAKSSILEQTYEKFEWIIVDDGSTDNTLDLVKELSDSDDRITVYTPGRLGRAKALNYAVKKANNEYIVNFDFDDISYDNRIKTQIEYLDEHPDVGVVGSYYILADEIRDERYIRKPPTDHEELVRVFARYIPFAHTMVAFRRAAWEKVDGYPDLDNAIDFGLWIRIAQTDWKFSNIPEVLGEHYVHEESFWNKNFNYSRQQKDIIRLHMKAIRELNLPKWMIIYSIGRLFYPFFPTSIKRLLRRTVGGSNEEDVPQEES